LKHRERRSREATSGGLESGLERGRKKNLKEGGNGLKDVCGGGGGEKKAQRGEVEKGGGRRFRVVGGKRASGGVQIGTKCLPGR